MRSFPPVVAVARRVLRPAALGLLAAGALAAGVLYVLKAPAVEGRTAAATHSATSWLDRQWQDFLRPTAIGGASNTARLATTKGTRSDLYRVAIDGFESSPLIGDGAGSYEPRFIQTRRVDEQVRNAHSLYLEVLSELGLVGGVLLALFVGSIVAAAIRSRVRPGGLGRSQTAAVAAASAVWLAHTAIDWDWQLPALTGIGLVLAATLFPYGRRPSGRRGRGRFHTPETMYFEEFEPSRGRADV